MVVGGGSHQCTVIVVLGLQRRSGFHGVSLYLGRIPVVFFGMLIISPVLGG